MKNFKNQLISDLASSDHREIEIYTIYLNNKSFRGFYYDINDKSYGIVLSFSSQDRLESLNLFAQVSQSGATIVEYNIHSRSFLIEQIAYDKVQISATSCNKELILPESGELSIPEVVEFTIQVLTRNSIYLRFLNHESFTPPINSFRGGLVLSHDHLHSPQYPSKITIKEENRF